MGATPQNPVVVTAGKQVSLAEKLDLRNMPLATTPGGKAFTMKALHPSDHEIKSARVPGGNTMSVALCSDQVTTIPITNAGATVAVNLIPHPWIPCTAHVQDGGSTNYLFMNAAFGGSVLQNPDSNQIENIASRWTPVEKYRITSQSVTVELIAPSLSDQGTVTAAQYRCPPRTVNPTATASGGGTFYVRPDVCVFETPVGLNQLVLGTSAYTAKARDGCYMPLKLTNFKWRDSNDPCYYACSPHQDTKSIESLVFSNQSGWPLYMTPHSACTSWDDIMPLPKMCGDNFGFVAFEGMAANVALRIRVRQVLEITSYPSTQYAPLLEVSLPPDDTAIRMYYEVSSRMADGYPASYNDLGKLKSIVSGIAKFVSPYVEPALNMLSGVPGIGTAAAIAKQAIPVVKAAVPVVRQAVTAIKARRKNRAKVVR